MRIAALATALASAIVGLSLADPAAAAIKARTNIAPQELSSALRVLAAERRLQILYTTDTVADRHSAGAVGEFTVDEALTRILSGTGLGFRYVDDNTITIMSHDAGASETPSAPQADRSGEDRAPAIKDPDEFRTRIQLEEIVVTGTHLRSLESSASPSYSFDQEDFAQAGATSVQQVLRQLPQNFQGGMTEVGATLSTSRNDGGANLSFGAGVNLRGLGNSSTLVLLNGRRLPAGGLGSFVDVSSIPLSALARIDVVPDGASAIYGSDAVGGVVNFVLRKDFEGVEASVRHGAVTEGNLRELDANTLFGTTWSTGAALVSLSYNRRDPLLASERDFASAMDQGGETHLTPDGRARAVLIDAHQDIGDALTLSATLYRTLHDGYAANFRAATPVSPTAQSLTDGSSDAIGGTMSLDWRVGNDWVLGVAQTLARNDADRDNVDTFGTDTFVTGLDAQHEISVTDIQAEGPIFSMPGGSARLAAGGEHRREALDLVRRHFIQPPKNNERSRDVNAAYLEAFLPFIGEANRKAWARRLELSAAVRYEDYDDVGSTTNSKFGAVWSPSDGIALRATYGTSFRAPYLFQFDGVNAAGVIYYSGFDSSQPIIAALTQAPAPGLGPEEATTWTAGLDFAPAALGGVKVAVTYFDIDYRDRIYAAEFALSPFNDPSLAPLLSQPPDPAILAEIARIQIENPGQYANYAFPATMADVQATFDGRVRNQSKTRISGVDFTLDKAFQLAQGRLDVGANASYLTRFENQTVSGAPVVDLVDTLFRPIDLRVRGYTSWARGGWVLSAIVNYMDDYKDNQLQPLIEDISSWTTIDLGLAYTFSAGQPLIDGLTLRFNAINAFDKDPPRVNDLFIVPGPGFGNPGFDPENASPIGRLVSFQVSKRW